MNRTEVTTLIRHVEKQFEHVMQCLCGHEYAAGYKQACADMIRLIGYAPIPNDWEAERAELVEEVRKLRAERLDLLREVNKKDRTIQKLLKHVNVADILGVDVSKDVKR